MEEAVEEVKAIPGKTLVHVEEAAVLAELFGDIVTPGVAPKSPPGQDADDAVARQLPPLAAVPPKLLHHKALVLETLLPRPPRAELFLQKGIS